MENCRNIFNIAARHGWSVSMEDMDGIRFLNFKRKTSSAVYHSALPLKPVTVQPAA